MVARLCLEEKGYNEDEYVLRHVDTSEHAIIADDLTSGIGENFSPGFLQYVCDYPQMLTDAQNG